MRRAVLGGVCGLAFAHAAAAEPVQLLGIEASDAGGALHLELRLDRAPAAREPFRLTAPDRLVLDLPGVVNATGRERFQQGGVRVRLGRHPGFLRVVLDLPPGAPPLERLDATADGLVLALEAPLLPAVGAPPPPRTQDEAAPPATAGEPAIRIYGVELQAAQDRDRVLVFSEHAIAAELVTLDADTLELRLPNAVLAPSAARKLRPEVGGAIAEVVVFAPLSKGAPEVRLQIERSPGAEAELSRRGAILAVEFPRPAGARETGLTLSFVDAELPEVVRAVAKETHSAFLFDDSLKGRVTISIVNRVTREEALEILQSALQSQGFAAVPSPGGAFRILPVREAKGAAPYFAGAPSSERAAPVTTLLRLRAADAQALVQALGALAGNELVVSAFAPTNSLVLTGNEAILQRYLALAQSLDDAESEELVVVALRHRDAAEIAELLQATAPAAVDAEERRLPHSEVWHDARTNSVLLRAPATRLAELRAWLAELDQPPAQQGAIRVIRPKNADAAQLAETLSKLAAGDASTAARSPRLAASGLSGRGFHVAAHESTGALLIQADPETHAIVRAVIEEIDRRPPTVAVDVTVLEITTGRSLALGIDAFLPFGDAEDPDARFAGAISIQSGLADVFEPVTDPGVGFFRYARAPLVIPVIGPGGIPIEVLVPREIVQLTAAEGTVEARTLLRPHLLALSGEEHELVAGDNVPILIGATDAAGAPVASDPLTIRNDIERRDVGTILRVRPTAGQAGGVRLELEIEASRVRPLPAGVAERIGPAIEHRKLSAVAALEPGQIAVLGMALDRGSMERESGVPFLSDIPILGWAFRTVTSEQAKRTLLIAVQADVERGPEARLAHSVRERLAFERALARSERLPHDAGYALRITTRTNAVEADAVASALRAAGAAPVEVVRWELGGEPRFDVYVGSYREIHAAVAAAEPLRLDGWRPDLVALPPRELGAVPAKRD